MQAENSTQHLSPFEQELLRWLLPESRPGYNAYLNDIFNATLLGNGRWGDGDYIFGSPGDRIDVTGPMERVFAFGLVSFLEGNCAITIHENVIGQIEVQFARTGRPDMTVKAVQDKYCYSYWRPGDTSPKTGSSVREVTLDHNNDFVLALSDGDEKIWLYEKSSGVNHLIPHMKFHKELMRVSGYRDKKQVFNPKLVLEQPSLFSDEELHAAVVNLNTTWNKVSLPDIQVTSKNKKGFMKRLFTRN